MEMETGKPGWRLLRRSYCQEMFIILFSDHVWPICDPWLDNLTNGGTIGHEVLCRSYGAGRTVRGSPEGPRTRKHPLLWFWRALSPQSGRPASGAHALMPHAREWDECRSPDYQVRDHLFIPVWQQINVVNISWRYTAHGDRQAAPTDLFSFSFQFSRYLNILNK